MPLQEANWTCSAAALAWVLRATGLDPSANEWRMVEAIGYPDQINAEYGLMDASGPALRMVYADYDQATDQGWLSFDEVYALAQHTTGQMSGARWYHWVGLRGIEGSNIAVANSSPGYRGVYSVLSREDFNRLGGFSVVWLI